MDFRSLIFGEIFRSLESTHHTFNGNVIKIFPTRVGSGSPSSMHSVNLFSDIVKILTESNCLGSLEHGSFLHIEGASE